MQAKGGGGAGHQQTMLVGPFVMTPHGFQPVGIADFRDRIGNSSGNMFCAINVDRPVARHDGEHRSKQGGPPSAVWRESRSSGAGSCAAPELVRAWIRAR